MGESDRDFLFAFVLLYTHTQNGRYRSWPNPKQVKAITEEKISLDTAKIARFFVRGSRLFCHKSSIVDEKQQQQRKTEYPSSWIRHEL